MKIIDKNTDFYDYWQDVYRDTSLTFDRRDSFVLTKDNLFSSLGGRNKYKFLLLQAGNTFWLFLLEVTKKYEWNQILDCDIELLHTWKNYNKSSVLLQLDVVLFPNYLYKYFFHKNKLCRLSKSSILDMTDKLINAINTNDYDVYNNLNYHRIYIGDHLYRDSRSKHKVVEKHIPLLKASGLSQFIDSFEMYLAIEEYLSSQKTASERTESVGITDREKIENHGFDTKTSFRGQQ